MRSATRQFDVFNGDADGICALHQLRLEQPAQATLITGRKREIALLERVQAEAGDRVTVLDISLARNRTALDALLQKGVRVDYFDHHQAGELPSQPGLHAIIDTTPDVCTGMLVDRFLHGRQRPWAVVAAFGDNLAEQARALGATAGMAAPQLALLQELGECLNYNAYGDSDEDLIIHPRRLYERLSRYRDPWKFFSSEPVCARLRATRTTDLTSANLDQKRIELAVGSLILLPDTAASRRVRGAFANQLATAFPEQAHAVLTPDRQQDYTISVRAPKRRLRGADTLCALFGGSGRAAAAGIDHLPRTRLTEFTEAFAASFRDQ
ncbi:MAG: acetyltransferase [Oxalobacteraceae bacterium]|nr:acetyltransferase [Oxalobacteraceae bacterium]